MIYHVFNSSLVSGPETLVLPALARLKGEARVLWLKESRIAEDKQRHVEEYFKSLNLPYDTIEVRSRWDSRAFQSMADLFSRRANLQIVHAHDVKPSIYLWQAFKRIQKPSFKIVSTHHGVSARSGFVNDLYEAFYVRFILPHFHRAFVVCSSDKHNLLKRGLLPEKVRVHLNGVTRAKIQLNDRTILQKHIRASWGLKDSDTVILGVVARLAPEKEHGLMLKTLARLNKIAPHLKVQILCFGRGELEDNLKKQTLKLGLQSQVFWMGYRAGIGQEFVGFDGILSFSKAEGLPINLIEAGWAGTPVFARSVDGVPDLISDESVGVLFASHEAQVIAPKLVDFVENQLKCSKMGLAFQKHVEQSFSEEVWLKELFELYSEIGVAGLPEVVK